MSRTRETGSRPEPAGLAPPPRANPDLAGHEAAEAELRRLFDSGRMPHALLLSGPRGIGKATLAFRLARFVLAQGGEGTAPSLFGGDSTPGLAIPPDSGVFRRVASGGHADLFTLERGYDRRGRLRTVITVDDAREIEKFLHLTPAEGGWRVVVVDGADAMNPNAENALLKILEEPPNRSLLLLVAHSTGRLLPTTRSRCRKLAMESLAAELVEALLRQYRPDLEASQIEALGPLAEGSIGRALDLAVAGGVDLHHSLLGFFTREGALDVSALHAFADRLTRREAEDAYRVVEQLIARLLAQLAAIAAGTEPRGRVEPESAALRRLGSRAPAARWATLRGEIEESFARTDALNLDRKQTILGAFFAIERTAG
jgi:DNA polymerase-3 subunit delta'